MSTAKLSGATAFQKPMHVKPKIYLESAEFSSDLTLIKAYWCKLGNENKGNHVWIGAKIKVWDLVKFVKDRYSITEVHDMVSHDGVHVQKEFKRDVHGMVMSDHKPFVKEYIEESGQVKSYSIIEEAEAKRARVKEAVKYWFANPDLTVGSIATTFDVGARSLAMAIEEDLKNRKSPN